MRFLLAGLAALIVSGPAFGANISTARYVEPTDAYGHGAVENGEYSALEVSLDTGETSVLRFENSVFEDTQPRLHDFDKDGVFEIVTVVSSFTEGARVQIFALRDNAIVPVLSNAPIGQRNRWLAIAGIADMDGDGLDEIAFVDRPHLAKTLKLLTVNLEGVRSTIMPLATMRNLSNHRYGAPDIEGGIRSCDGQPPAIITASGNWQNVVEIKWSTERSTLVSEVVARYQNSASFTEFLSCD